MSTFITKLVTTGYLVLAAVPVVALSASIADAQPAPVTVKIGDLDLTSKAGMDTFEQRATVAGEQFCRGEHSLSGRESCAAAIRAEAHDKLAAVIAQSVMSTKLAAR